MSIKDRLLCQSQVQPNGCRLWLGYKNGSGYGQFSIKGKKYYVHRVAYATFIGPIPEGLTIDHLCFARVCIEPTHLEAVTQTENSNRNVERYYRDNPNYPCGHPRTVEFTVVHTSRSKSNRPKYPRRKCLPCTRAYINARNAKRKELSCRK